MVEDQVLDVKDVKDIRDNQAKDLPDTQPPMQLEQDYLGMWEYWRDPWLYGPGITRNGVMPVHMETLEEAQAYVNRLYPGSFPEPPPEEAPPPAK